MREQGPPTDVERSSSVTEHDAASLEIPSSRPQPGALEQPGPFDQLEKDPDSVKREPWVEHSRPAPAKPVLWQDSRETSELVVEPGISRSTVFLGALFALNLALALLIQSVSAVQQLNAAKALHTPTAQVFGPKIHAVVGLLSDRSLDDHALSDQLRAALTTGIDLYGQGPMVPAGQPAPTESVSYQKR